MDVPYKLYKGDCLEIMPQLEAGSVDAIITDLPYGTTDCEWDSVISLVEMWKEVKRVLKPSGVFITTSSQPFTSALIMSNPEMFKYELIWNKKLTGNFLLANFQPMRIHENILVFSQYPATYVKGKENAAYYPQKVSGKFRKSAKSVKPEVTRSDTDYIVVSNGGSMRFPQSIIDFSNAHRIDKEHPTQKPVALYEYLIRTYTNPNELVLDICMGSGTTIVAAVQTGRKAIGIEKEHKYFEIAVKRAGSAQSPLFVEPPRSPTKRAPDLGRAAAQNELFD